MKKILTILLGVLAVGFTGCLKDTSINTNGLDKTTTYAEIPYSGLENFSASTVLTAGATSPIVVPFVVNLTQPVTKDVTVTLAYDDAARTAYNTANSSGPQYDAIPDSCYSFAVKTAVIKAGTQQASFSATFYPTKVDPTKNYMAAISIKDAQGQTISGNFSTYYMHTLGNPLAGNYNVTGTRYNYTGTVSWNNVLPVPPGYTATTNMALYSPRLGSPDNTTTIEIPFGNVGTGYNYIITLTGTNSISVDYTFDALYSNIVTSLATYNSATKTMHIITHYNNALAGAGNDRIFDETFVHQ